jgi:DNA-binding XRE family transcriptional regulator
MTLKEYRVNLGWSHNQLAKAAGIARQTVVSAEEGELITAATAKAIADALSKAYGRTINVTDIEGLNIR